MSGVEKPKAQVKMPRSWLPWLGDARLLTGSASLQISRSCQDTGTRFNALERTAGRDHRVSRLGIREFMVGGHLESLEASFHSFEICRGSLFESRLGLLNARGQRQKKKNNAASSIVHCSQKSQNLLLNSRSTLTLTYGGSGLGPRGTPCPKLVSTSALDRRGTSSPTVSITPWCYAQKVVYNYSYQILFALASS